MANEIETASAAVETETAEKKKGLFARFGSWTKAMKVSFAMALTAIVSSVGVFASESTPPASSGSDVGLTQAIEDIGEFFTALLGWLGDAAQVLVTNWVIVVFVVAIPVAGWVFSLLFSLIGRSRGRRR